MFLIIKFQKNIFFCFIKTTRVLFLYLKSKNANLPVKNVNLPIKNVNLPVKMSICQVICRDYII